MVLIADLVAVIPNGASLMIGGFMGVGTPTRLIDELLRQGKRDLTVIANDTARPGINLPVESMSTIERLSSAKPA